MFRPVDPYIAKLSRRLRPLPGARHLVRRLQRHYNARYAERSDRWITIDDYDGDLSLTLSRTSHVGGTIFWHGFHSRNEITVLGRLLRPGMVFIDAGAHMGEFTLYAAKRVGVAGRVLAFEPMPSVFRLLEHNVELNGLGNVTTRCAGLLDTPGQIELFGGAPCEERAFDDDTVATAFSGYGRTVKIGEAEAVTLDEEVQRHGLRRVDVIKMDIEGAEARALKGAWTLLQRWRPSLILEMSEVLLKEVNDSFEDIFGLLEPLGYRFFLISDFSVLESLRRSVSTGSIHRYGRLEPIFGRRAPKACNIACIAKD